MQLDSEILPRHIGIIMDGNRRWAKKRGLAVIAGHTKAAESTVEALIERAGERGVKYLTLWAFSTENWERDSEEVNGVMNLFRKALATKVASFIKKGAKLNLIGDIARFAPDLQSGMEKSILDSSGNSKITVTFALNYGGRDEIRRAVEKGGVQFEQYLDTAGMPDPDLIIRTGGEKRMSGFLMWQAAYSELYFSDVLFPDFGPSELDQAIEEYTRRQRRFGK